MSSPRTHLHFTAGVLSSSTLCPDSVDALLPCASEDVLESLPVWNGKWKSMVSGVGYHDNQVYPSRAYVEHKLTDYIICFLNRTDQPNCHLQPQDWKHQDTRNTSTVPNSPHTMQVKGIKLKLGGTWDETKKTLFLWLEHHSEAFCGYLEWRKLTGWIR